MKVTAAAFLVFAALELTLHTGVGWFHARTHRMKFLIEDGLFQFS